MQHRANGAVNRRRNVSMLKDVFISVRRTFLSQTFYYQEDTCVLPQHFNPLLHDFYFTSILRNNLRQSPISYRLIEVGRLWETFSMIPSYFKIEIKVKPPL